MPPTERNSGTGTVRQNPMHGAFQDELAFHLTGRLRAATDGPAPEDGGGTLEPIAGGDLLPALFAPYAELTRLRHDFPLLLAPGAPATSLTAVMESALAGQESGDEEAATRLRHHGLRLERALRTLAARQGAMALADAWEKVAAELVAADGEIGASLQALRPAFPAQAVLAGCDRALPAALLQHEWQRAQDAKVAALRQEIETLVHGLEDILAADFITSPAGRSPERLRATIGAALADHFDLAAMASLLDRGRTVATLQESRRNRLNGLLKVLRNQRYAPLADSGVSPHPLTFTSARAALAAWRERLPARAELARALAMARLEVAGEYAESHHDALFARFDDRRASEALEAIAVPSLVCLQGGAVEPLEIAAALEAIAAGLPFKVLVQVDSLFDAEARLTPQAVLAHALTASAIGFADAAVLQTTSARLLASLELLQRVLAHHGPGLVAVFSGAGPEHARLPAYLVAAAALEARVFPALFHDPQAARPASLDGNPAPEADWPEYTLDCEDKAQQRLRQDVTFTALDFLAADPRLVEHCARLSPGADTSHLVPAAEALAAGAGETEQRLPYLLMADPHGRLHKVLADETLLAAARQVLRRWQALRVQYAPPAPVVVEAPAVEVPAAPETTPAEAPPAAPAAEEAPADPDAPSIETSRCSSCGACLQVNDKLFAYNADRQAVIKDLAAGTFRDLVEAAEGCPLAIIHPGKPRDPNEEGLAELLARAAAL